MVYVAPDGRVLAAKPWGLHTIPDFFWGVINVIQMFFLSLIDPNSSSKGAGWTTEYRNTGGRGGPPGGGPRRWVQALAHPAAQADGWLRRRAGRRCGASHAWGRRMRLKRRQPQGRREEEGG
jgi:hypothetical protein